MSDTRLPVRWATYPGDCRGILTEGPKGPNTFGELLWPVAADFDGETTRVGFSYVAPPEFAQRRTADYFAQRKADAAAVLHIAALIDVHPEVKALLTDGDS